MGPLAFSHFFPTTEYISTALAGREISDPRVTKSATSNKFFCLSKVIDSRIIPLKSARCPFGTWQRVAHGQPSGQQPSFQKLNSACHCAIGTIQIPDISNVRSKISRYIRVKGSAQITGATCDDLRLLLKDFLEYFNRNWLFFLYLLDCGTFITRDLKTSRIRDGANYALGDWRNGAVP